MLIDEAGAGGAGVCARQGTVVNAASETQTAKKRNMVSTYLDKDAQVYRGLPRDNREPAAARVFVRSVERKMRVADAGPLQRRDHAIELRDVGHGSDADAVHPASRDLIVAHKNLAQVAAAQSLRQSFRIGGIGECAGLHEQRGRGSLG